MATAKAKKKVIPNVNLPECPVCLDTMSAPIYQCQSGHSLCSSCTAILSPPICPICRQIMTQMRNWQLEEIIAKASTVSCPNNSLGCTYVASSKNIDKHLKECIYRDMLCPIGAAFGKCSWKGKVGTMLQHFKDHHPDNCSITPDVDVELTDISIAEDNRRVYLLAQGKILFIITMKIDTQQKVAYWVVQHIGMKKVSNQYVYEIHITSKQDSQRKVMFSEICFNDFLKAEAVFKHGKCGIIPLSMLNNFIQDRKLLFKISIKKLSANPKQKLQKDDENNGNQPIPEGHQRPGPKGPRKYRPGPTTSGS